MPAFVAKVDPFKGPVDVALEKRSTENLGPKYQLRGRVIDPEGKPVSGAVVSFDFFYGDEANCGGACEGVDPLAVTDEDGAFLIATTKRFDWMTVTVEARTFAKRKFFKLPSGKPQELKLTEGATVKGRILHEGKPVKSVEIGLVSVDRSDNFTGEYIIGTDSEGCFQLLNVPPYQIYYLYGRIDSFKRLGAIAVKKIRVSADGSIKDLGEMTVEPGLRIIGQVVLSDSQAIPPNTKVILGREDAWDSTTVELDASGRFEFGGVPAGSISLSVGLRSYHLSEKNKSLDWLNGGSIVGRIEQDTAGLTLLLEPGPVVQPDFSKVQKLGPDAQPRDKLLRGAESPSL